MTATAPRIQDAPSRPVDPPPGEEVLRVSARSDVKGVAGAVAACVRGSGSAVIEVIGAGALNQAVKATIVARIVTEPEGLDLVVTPSFHAADVDGQERTAIRLRIDRRR